jgi:hypothetical protein
MWSTLVELIERWWRDKPRLDVVRSVICLRDAMEACRTSYAVYRTVETNGCMYRGPEPQSREAELQRLRAQWGNNVEFLTRQVLELGTVLEIFSPSLHRELETYRSDERSSFLGEEVLNKMALELRQAPEIGIAQVEIPDKYQTALAELDAFIRENFKMEEIHAVQSRRWR